MIDLKFGLWWSGHELSYLRYLTFKSLRHFHPDSTIQLYIGDKYSTKNCKWRDEKQDFQGERLDRDYLNDLDALNIEIIHVDLFSDCVPSFQSDFFRWWWLSQNNGFYLDTDQIILRSFETMERDCYFILTRYKLSWGADYYPVGVIGGMSGSDIVNYTNEQLYRFYNPNDYNSLGPWGFETIYNSRPWKSKVYFTPPHYFYPVQESQFIPTAYNKTIDIPSDSYCFHWFGGLPQSQEFNKSYTEEFAKNHNDTISSILRKNGLL